MKFTHVKSLALLAMLAMPRLAGAQAVQCPTLQPADLVRVPEIQAQDHRLRGTIVVSAEQECIGFRVPASKPAANSTMTWQPQWVRTMRGTNTTPPTPVTPKNQYGTPLPGPTLRARVGDLVQLTLLNQIDTGVFPYSIDRGETSASGGCDQTSLYPTNTAAGVADTYPDCFHGSSTANMHFHGTHTNPNTTGDNVFLEIRPSLRTKDQANKPIVTAASVKPAFDDFFRRCEVELPSNNPTRQWPFTWNDLPKAFTERQEVLLKEYDANPKIGRKLWPVDAKERAQGNWPQYYIGAYPYCYRIPEYKQSTWPPTMQAEAKAAHTHGAGTGEATAPSHPLIMGQSPGTHWYHAHKHGSTAIDVANGMTGAFIIEGKYDDDLDTYYGAGWTRKQPVMVIQQIGVTPNLERGGGGTGSGQDKGPNFSINGAFAPIVKMAPGEVQLWRIVNTSGRAGAYLVGPPTGFHWRQLAQDGVQFNDDSYKADMFHDKPITLYAGNRADILVQAPTTAPNGNVNFMVQNIVDPSDLTSNPPAYPMTLLSVNVTGTPATGHNAEFIPTAPKRPDFLDDIKDSEVTGTKSLLFASQFNGANAPPPSLHTINGVQFSGEVGEVVLLNTVEEWKVSNATYGPLISHPFHIHINPFQVVEVFAPNELIPGTTLKQYVFDQASKTDPRQCVLNALDPETWKPCFAMPDAARSVWWDVFGIPAGVTSPVNDPKTGKPIQVPGHFKMRSRFVDFSGYYVLHCHILAHEDRGMMTVVEVAPLQSPYSHH